MYQVLVIDDDKLARKGLISLIPWEKYGMGVYLRVQGAGNFHGLYCAFRT